MDSREHDIRVDFDSAMPIYAQIVDQVACIIDSGAWKAGRRIQSVRELSIRLRINPMTVQKAYQHLKVKGYVMTRRGAGVFVQERRDRSELQRRIQELVARGRQLGVDIKVR